MKQNELIGMIFEVKMRTIHVTDEGDKKSVTHIILTEALSFSQAESQARAVITALWPDDTNPFAFAMRITTRREIILPPGTAPVESPARQHIYQGTWYQAIVEWSELIEDTGKYRKQRKAYLILTDQDTESAAAIISDHLAAQGITDHKLRRIELIEAEAVAKFK